MRAAPYFAHSHADSLESICAGRWRRGGGAVGSGGNCDDDDDDDNCNNGDDYYGDDNDDNDDECNDDDDNDDDDGNWSDIDESTPNSASVGSNTVGCGSDSACTSSVPVVVSDLGKDIDERDKMYNLKGRNSKNARSLAVSHGPPADCAKTVYKSSSNVPEATNSDKRVCNR